MAKKAELKLDTDPRPLDRPIFNRLRELVEKEATHEAWASALYALHRLGRLDNDQREAGDKYASLIRDHRKLWKDRVGFGAPDLKSVDRTRAFAEMGMAHVIADDLAEESEFEIARARRISRRYREAAGVAGPARDALESMLIDDIWPVGERGHRAVAHALTRLFHFFTTGTKRKR